MALPIVLFMSSLLFLAILVQLSSLEYEQRLVTAQKQQLMLQSLLQVAFEEFKDNPEQDFDTKVFSYEHGNVTLSITNKFDDYVLEIAMLATLTNGYHKRAIFRYDIDNKVTKEYWEVK